jgi:hypothetical protein
LPIRNSKHTVEFFLAEYRLDKHVHKIKPIDGFEVKGASVFSAEGDMHRLFDLAMEK